MNVSGEFAVNAPRAVVFKTLRDAGSFVRFVDGVRGLKGIDGSADDWPALGIAAVVDATGDDIRSVHLVASASTDRATRLKSAEAVLNGKTADDRLMARAAEAALEDCELLADVRGSAAYELELMRVYIPRAVHAAFNSGTRP